MDRKIILIYFQLFICLLGFSQTKQKNIYQQIWMGYFKQTCFNDRWGIWTDLHLRTKDDFVNNLSTGIIRLGLTYYLQDDLKLTAGYA